MQRLKELFLYWRVETVDSAFTILLYSGVLTFISMFYGRVIINLPPFEYLFNFLLSMLIGIVVVIVATTIRWLIAIFKK